MKVKVLSRNPDDYVRETKFDVHRVPRNYDPAMHPFHAEREYVRAVNATKLERVFAKPFLAALDGHSDGVHCMAKDPVRLTTVYSGSYDGEVRMWDLPKKTSVGSVQAHSGYVRGITLDPSGERLCSVGDDKTIKVWRVAAFNEPSATYLSKQTLQDVSHHWQKPVFATAGETVQIWDSHRATPIRDYSWGVDTISRIRFNPVETELLAGVASDRSIILYDCRGQTPLRKVLLKLRSNSIAWNPMEAFVFTVANEDYNLYSFDVRNLKNPVNMHMNHVSAVLDVDYSPSGREFVSGSYDKTIRIWQVDRGRSREVYHTKRMQRVMCVCWSADSRYILSGSDDMNLRLWKAQAAEKLGILRPREVAAQEYAAKLKEKFAAHPEIRRIARHRHVPKHVYHAQEELRTIKTSQKRKESNRRTHSKPGSVPFVAELRKHTVGEQE